VTQITDREAPHEHIERTRHVAANTGAIMKLNVGSLDRALRIVAGVALIGLTVAGTIGPWGWIGVVPLATGLVGFCPVYPLLGMNTCSMKKA
jgi:hypothetical protein